MSTLPSPNDRSLTLETRSPEETRRLAAALSPVLRPGDVISLSGDLGAGKTTFVQGLAAGIGVIEHVTSPTFILMKEYHGGRYPLMHIDVYRLEKAQEVIDLGYDEFLDPSYIVVVEWGDVIEPMLPEEHLLVEITQTDNESVRTISLIPRGGRWHERMATVGVLSAELFSAGRDEDPRLKTGAFRVGEQKPEDEN
jgi:tRNA threonylcarbamoyladenosine biosynthesis protein TsaE